MKWRMMASRKGKMSGIVGSSGVGVLDCVTDGDNAGVMGDSAWGSFGSSFDQLSLPCTLV